MTENIKPKNSYSHADLMRYYNAITKSCGTQFDALFLACAYLQHAVDKETFLAMIKVLEMSETELKRNIFSND
jgi:hypothetical protein